MEVKVNIIDTLFTTIPKDTVVASYTVDEDNVEINTDSKLYYVNKPNKTIHANKNINSNNIEAIHFTVRNWVNGEQVEINDMYPRVVSELQNKFNKPNTIYKVTKDLDLNHCVLTIPEGCTLQFDGGSISNGDLVGNDTIIYAGIVKIFDATTKLLGDWNNLNIYTEWFGVRADGKTDDSVAIQAILNSNPESIIFPNKKIIFTSSINTNKSIRLEGNGSTLLFNTDSRLNINYHTNRNSNVNSIEYTTSSARISKVYMSDTSMYEKGDIVKIYSDDLIEGTLFNLSQYFIVAGKSIDYIEVTGKVIFDFTTNIKVQAIDKSKKLQINNLILSSLDSTVYSDLGLVTVIGGAYHLIKDCAVKNTNNHGVLFAGSYGYTVENLELDYQDFANQANPKRIGMGVCDSASSNFTISFKGGYTQAFTCVYYSNDNYPETKGVSQFGLIKNSVTSGSALDNHTNAYRLVYSDCIVSSSENGIVVRGSGCIYDNIIANASIYGLYVYADNHNTGNTNDFLIRNSTINSYTRCVQIENNKDTKITGIVENCILTGRTAAIVLKNADIVFRNCTITGLVTINNKTSVIFDNCTINGNINVIEGVTDSNITIRNSIINATNHLYFRECPATIENTTININDNYYILVTLATNIVFNKVVFNTSYQYLLRTQNSAVVELNDCIINHTGTNPEFHVFRTIGITIDVILKTIFNNLSIYNKAPQSTIVYLSYVDSWKGGSSINNRVKSVYVDNSLLDGIYICNRTDKIMVVNDILDNPYYIERGDINTDGTLKSKEVIVYRVEDIVPGLTNTIYKIVKDIDLDGQQKGIPADCTLDFQGGSFSNGTLIGSNTTILPNGYKIQNVDLKSSFKYPDGVNAVSSDGLCLNNVYDILDKQNLATTEINNYVVKDDDYTILSQFDTLKNVNAVDGSFIGFPTSVIYNNLLYCFYYKANTHESTPGIQENIYYKYSSDKGITWSEEKEWVLPSSDSNGTYRSYRTAYVVPFGSNLLFGIFCTTTTSSAVGGSFTLVCEATISEAHDITILNQIKTPIVGASGSLVYNYTDATITNSMIIGGNIIQVGSNYLVACYTSNRNNYVFSFDGNFTDNTHITQLDVISSEQFDYTEHAFIKFSDTNFYIAFREDARRENTPIFKYDTSTSKFELFTYIDNVAYDGLDAIILDDNTAMIAGRDARNYFTPTRFALMNSSGKVFISNAKYYGDVLGRDCGYCSLQIIEDTLINIFYLKRSQPNYNYGVVSRRIPVKTLTNLIFY